MRMHVDMCAWNAPYVAYLFSFLCKCLSKHLLYTDIYSARSQPICSTGILGWYKSFLKAHLIISCAAHGPMAQHQATQPLCQHLRGCRKTFGSRWRGQDGRYSKVVKTQAGLVIIDVAIWSTTLQQSCFQVHSVPSDGSS